jgi:hypothetical protein
MVLAIYHMLLLPYIMIVKLFMGLADDPSVRLPWSHGGWGGATRTTPSAKASTSTVHCRLRFC